MSRRAKWIFSVAAALIAVDAVVLAFIFATDESPVVVASSSSAVVSSGTALIGGPFALVRTDGTAVTDQTYLGKWMLIYFGYTHCPDICPLSLANIGAAVEKLGPEASKLQPLFITVDPKRDTREVLGEYLWSFDARIIGLTGSEEQTGAVAKAYKVSVESHQGQGNDSYLVDHSSYVYLMDPRGKFVDVIEGATPPAQLADWLRKSMRDNSTCEVSDTCDI